MSLELIDIALAERQEHPRLSHRITGKVRAVLAETIDGQEHVHELMIPAWVETTAEMTAEDIDLALLVKAADIVGRMKSRMAAAEAAE